MLDFSHTFDGFSSVGFSSRYALSNIAINLGPKKSLHTYSIRVLKSRPMSTVCFNLVLDFLRDNEIYWLESCLVGQVSSCVDKNLVNNVKLCVHHV